MKEFPAHLRDMVTMDTDTMTLDTTDTITMVTVTDAMTAMDMDTTVPMLEVITRDPTTTMDHTMITFMDVDTDTTPDTINLVIDKIS